MVRSRRPCGAPDDHRPPPPPGADGMTAPAGGHPLPGSGAASPTSRRNSTRPPPAPQYRDGHGHDLPLVTKDAKARRDSSCARAMSKCLVTSSSGSRPGRAVRGSLEFRPDAHVGDTSTPTWPPGSRPRVVSGQIAWERWPTRHVASRGHPCRGTAVAPERGLAVAAITCRQAEGRTSTKFKPGLVRGPTGDRL